MAKTTTCTGSVPVAGGLIRLHRRGQRGPAVVLVHYWGGSAATWQALVDRLPADRETVRYDQRGWGASRRLPGPYHLDQLADDLLDVVRGAGLEHYVVVGHSMGGKVAQLVAPVDRPGWRAWSCWLRPRRGPRRTSPPSTGSSSPTPTTHRGPSNKPLTRC